MSTPVTFLVSIFIFINVTAQDIEMWGTTRLGGDYNAGTIFKIDSQGNNHQLIHSFEKVQGKYPATDLVEMGNGILYGMAESGGNSSSNGVIYTYDINTKKYDIKHVFNDTNGRHPKGGLTLAGNGKLYGLTSSGGAFNRGVIFEFDPITETQTVKYSFPVNGNTGENPYGTLVLAGNGKLYGTTYWGGTYAKGVLFEFNPLTGAFAKKKDFNGVGLGKQPGSLMKASNGKLYGITSYGGTGYGPFFNYGTLFEYNPSNNLLIKKYDFNASSNGRVPMGRLVQGDNGHLYGMTYEGGTYGVGVLFEFNISSSVITKKIDFNPTITGGQPKGSLAKLINGEIYGMTYGGGAKGYGVLFEYNVLTNVISPKVNFSGTVNGGEPVGSVLQASNGKLYGVTEKGGHFSQGTLFEFDDSLNIFNSEFSFQNSKEGKEPSGTLIQGSNGKLYGMTEFGGNNNDGVIYEYSPITGGYSKLFDFQDSLYGAQPISELLEANNGKLYGVTRLGGIFGFGVLFEYNVNTSSFIKLIDFDGASKGKYPKASLLQASNGKIYGTTSYGGSSDDGVLFEYNPITNVFVKKKDFVETYFTSTGRSPNSGRLLQANNGKLYGMTEYGGQYDGGVLYSYDLNTNSYVIIKTFQSSPHSYGIYPKGGVIQAANGKIYGHTTSSANNSAGGIFEYDPVTTSFFRWFSYSASNSSGKPCGTMLQASNGKFYGTATISATSYKGSVFEYNHSTHTVVTKHHFVGLEGERPLYGSLIETNYCYPEFTIDSIHACDSLTWVNGITYYSSITGVVDSLTNVAGCDSIVTLDLTINPSYLVVDAIVACDSLTWINGVTYYSSINGVYDTLISSTGCDSIIILDLTIHSIDQSITQSVDTLWANETGANYQWIDCNSSAIIMGETNSMFVPMVTGNYAVEITKNGCVDTSSCITVFVCDAIANYSLSMVSAGEYSFTQNSMGSYTSINWAFGDGYRSIQPNPTHTYTQDGDYVVVLAIHDSNVLGGGCISYFTDTLQVRNTVNIISCNASWVVYGDTISGGVTVINTSTGNNLSYHWDFGDGDTSNLQFPSHSYQTNGPFDLCLTINDGNGCTDTYCDTIGANGVWFKNGFELNVKPNQPLDISTIELGEKVKVYPNPTPDLLYMELSNLTVKQLNVLDASGKVVKVVKSTFERVDVSSLAKGWYHVQIMAEEGVVVKRFMKQ